MAESAEQAFRDHLQRARDTLKHCGIKDDQIEEKLRLCKEGIIIGSRLYVEPLINCTRYLFNFNNVELRKLNDPAPAENTESRVSNVIMDDLSSPDIRVSSSGTMHRLTANYFSVIC